MSKCIILVINFQNSPSARGSPLPDPLIFDIGDLKLSDWPNCGFSNWLWQNRTLKNQLRRHFSDVITITPLKNIIKITSQNFSILLLPQLKFLAISVGGADETLAFASTYW